MIEFAIIRYNSYGDDEEKYLISHSRVSTGNPNAYIIYTSFFMSHFNIEGRLLTPVSLGSVWRNYIIDNIYLITLSTSD